MEVPGAVLRLAILDGSPAADPDAMRAWIQDAAMSVAAIHGKFPVPSPQVLVMPGARASEPTPWAYVLRGGQAAAHFFVNQRRPLRDYVDDWTAPHELSHLLLPYVSSNDAWLSEGMATYYQNVARARSGAITPGEAWQRMHAGFKRGRDGGAKGPTLEQATARMFRDGGYMRVYWSGAAMLMLGDIELRRRSDNRQSLDTVLGAFAECCLDPYPEWTARKVFEKFDELSGTDIFRYALRRARAVAGVPRSHRGLRPARPRGARRKAGPQVRRAADRDTRCDHGARRIRDATGVARREIVAPRR